MLFGYPLSATNENWLHDCIVEMLTTIHENLGRDVSRPKWPDIIPSEYRSKIKTRTGLRDRLEAYRKAIVALSLTERQQIALCIVQQNKISELCENSLGCEDLSQLPASAQNTIKALFDFAFSLLTPMGVRDRQYRTIYEQSPYHICPFCGCEYFDAPGGPREDLDHYLPKSHYPFAAVNLRNLVPMGMKCNERYKKADDILWTNEHTRRRVFDPYKDREVRISLDKSLPFMGLDGQIPKWEIEFIPDSEECTTWDNVFQFRARIVRDVLNPDFNRWLRGFQAWFKSLKTSSPDDTTVITAIKSYADYFTTVEYGDRAFLKSAVFQMIHRKCNTGDLRLREFMCELVGIKLQA